LWWVVDKIQKKIRKKMKDIEMMTMNVNDRETWAKK
jgi:hypothetical protein